MRSGKIVAQCGHAVEDSSVRKGNVPKAVASLKLL